MKNLIIALCLSCLFCYQALAADTNPGKVTSVQLGSVGDIFIRTETALINPSSCTASTYVVPKTHAAYNEYYVMLLSAMDSGDDIVLRVDDSNCVLNSLYPSVILMRRTKS